MSLFPEGSFNVRVPTLPSDVLHEIVKAPTVQRTELTGGQKRLLAVVGVTAFAVLALAIVMR